MLVPFQARVRSRHFSVRMWSLRDTSASFRNEMEIGGGGGDTSGQINRVIVGYLGWCDKRSRRTVLPSSLQLPDWNGNGNITRQKAHLLETKSSSSFRHPRVLSAQQEWIGIVLNGDVFRSYARMCMSTRFHADNIAAKMFPVNDISDFHLRSFPCSERWFNLQRRYMLNWMVVYGWGWRGLVDTGIW